MFHCAKSVVCFEIIRVDACKLRLQNIFPIILKGGGLMGIPKRVTQNECTQHDNTYSVCVEHHGTLLVLSCELKSKTDDNLSTTFPSSPPIDSIWALVLVWRIRRKIIRTALCCVVCDRSQLSTMIHTHVSSSYIFCMFGLDFLYVYIGFRNDLLCQVGRKTLTQSIKQTTNFTHPFGRVESSGGCN